MVLGERGDAVFELGVEADDDRARGAGHEDVVLANQADLPGKDFEGDLRALDAVENVAHGLDGAEHVALQHDAQRLLLRRGDLGEKLLDRNLLRLRVQRDGLLLEAVLLHLGQPLGLAGVLHRLEGRAAVGGAGPADDLHRHGGRRLLHRLAPVVEHGAHPGVMRAAHDGVARVERAPLHDDGRGRTAADVDLRLDDDARGLGLRIGLQLEHVGLQKDVVEQVGDALVLDGGHGHGDGLAAPVLGRDAAFLHLALHAVEVGAFDVHLVDRDDERDLGVLHVLERLVGLRHETVVSRHHKHGDVGDIGTAGAHLVEGGVTGRVEEGDLAVFELDLIGADVLGDAACLAGGDVGLADGVEQRGLAVIHVTEDAHHRWTRLEELGLVLHGLLHLFLGGNRRNHLAAMLDLEQAAVPLGDLHRHRLLDALVHPGEDAHFHQFTGEFERFQTQRRREVAHNDRRLEMDDFDVTRRNHRDGGRRGGDGYRRSGQRPGNHRRSRTLGGGRRQRRSGYRDSRRGDGDWRRVNHGRRRRGHCRSDRRRWRRHVSRPACRWSRNRRTAWRRRCDAHNRRRRRRPWSRKHHLRTAGLGLFLLLAGDVLGGPYKNSLRQTRSETRRLLCRLDHGRCGGFPSGTPDRAFVGGGCRGVARSRLLVPEFLFQCRRRDLVDGTGDCFDGVVARLQQGEQLLVVQADSFGEFVEADTHQDRGGCENGKGTVISGRP